MLDKTPGSSIFHTLNLYDFDDCMFHTSAILRKLTNTLLFEAVLKQCRVWGIKPPMWLYFKENIKAMRASHGSLTKAWQLWLEAHEPIHANKKDKERFNKWAYDVYRTDGAAQRMLMAFMKVTKPDPELRQLLENLASSGHKLGIFTQNHKAFVRLVLTYMGVGHLFKDEDIVDIVDTDNNPKTTGSAFLYARERFGYGYESSNMFDDKLANFTWARIYKFRCWHIHPDKPPAGMADMHFENFKQALRAQLNPLELAA